jgi:hypothetical protein
VLLSAQFFNYKRGGTVRQTNFTVAELADFLETGVHPMYPRCLLVNELGEWAQEGNSQAQNKLVDFLETDDVCDKFISYGHLVSIGQKSNKITAALKNFAAKKENAEIIEEVKDCLAANIAIRN